MAQPTEFGDVYGFEFMAAYDKVTFTTLIDIVSRVSDTADPNLAVKSPAEAAKFVGRSLREVNEQRTHRIWEDTRHHHPVANKADGPGASPLVYASKKGQPPSLNARPQAWSATPLAIKDTRSKNPKPRNKRVCSRHDPANNKFCQNDTSCPDEHMDMLTTEGAALFNKVKTIFDNRYPAGKSSKGKGKHR